VSRDNFNSRLNEDYKRQFSVALTLVQSSIVSSVATPLTVAGGLTRWAGDWAKKTVLDDALKSFWDRLPTHDFDVIILDNFSDVRFGYCEILGTRVTRNVWHLPGTDYATLFEANSYMEFAPRKQPDVYRKEYRNAVAILLDRIYAKHPAAKIVLNSARAASVAKNDAGEIVQRYDMLEFNRAWEMLDAEFLALAPQAIQIRVPDDLIVGWTGHPWGIGYVHYRKPYYQEFIRRLSNALGPHEAHIATPQDPNGTSIRRDAPG